jgi:predicted nucleic acid-binding protein
VNNKAIVLDANILIRAVLGKRVRELIFTNASTVKFFAPDVAYADARKYLPSLLEKRGVKSAAAMKVLDSLECIVQSIDLELYVAMQQKALQRIAIRDADDWPVLACSMVIGCPVWTEQKARGQVFHYHIRHTFKAAVWRSGIAAMLNRAAP